jgi:PRC-barrel domain
MERIDRPNVYLSFLTIMETEMIKLCEVLALLLFAALAPDSNAAAQPAGPTIAVSASQQMKDGTAVVDLPDVAGMNARDVYSANGERIGELSEIVLDDARRPVAASIETDEGPGGNEHIVGAEKLRLKGSRLVTSLTRQQVEAMPRVND